MSLETSTTMIELGLLGVILLSIALGLVLKAHFNKLEASNLTEANRNRVYSSPSEGRTKYPELDVFKAAISLRFYGIAMAMLLMIFAFSWTTFEKKIDVSGLLGSLDDVIEMETPRTAELPPPPPPPPPTVNAFVATDMPDVETRIFQDLSISEETDVVAAPIEHKEVAKAVAPPPPPPPPSDESEREIFKVVEEAPTFPGCEGMEVKEERMKCAEIKLLEFIYQNIQYPTIARENGVSGMVYIRFVVEKDGSITNIEAVRDVGGGCGDEAIRVVKLMPKWNPGRQRGNAVRVMFTLPVKFELK